MMLHTLISGPESSRISMARIIVNMELIESDLKLLGEEGVIPPFVQMVFGNLESKELALSALEKLSDFDANKELIATAGGVDLVVNLLHTPHVCSIIIVKCCDILEKILSGDDGIKLLVDENGSQLELEPIVTNLLELQQSQNSSHNARKPALRAVLGICKYDAELVKKTVLTVNGVSLVLPLLDDSDSEIREIAINLLFLFSQHEPEGVVEYLLKPRRLEALVGFLENEDNGDVKMAAAGLLANLPKSERSLTKKLIELDGHNALINILRNGTKEAKENALSALFRFTDPSNLNSQRSLVDAGVYPLLVNFLSASSVEAKARAAALIGNISTNSQKLTVMPKSAGGCWCFRPKGISVCPAHGGVCSVNSNFCLLEANALPGLVKLVHEKVHQTAIEAIQTLSTLVHEGFPHRGANVLHEADAIKPILDTLTWGTNPLKEESLALLEKVFVSKEMVENYGLLARFLLVSLTSGNVQADGNPGRRAAKVLSLLERYSISSTSIIPGLHG